MYLSTFSTVVTGSDPEEVAAKTAALGLKSVQFIAGRATIGFGFDQNQSDESFERWAAAYRREGVEICGVGGYINLLHHDPAKRRQNIDAFKSYLRGMTILGCRYISTETGSYSIKGDWEHDPRNRTAAAWDDLRRVTDELLDVAAAEGVVILYEPYIVNVCYTPELGARLVREIGSPHLALLMDPTNWFEADLVRADLVASVIERGFAAERGLFHLAHAKDVTPAPASGEKPGLPGPGQGLLDYATYIRLLREHGYDGPLIIEHLTEAELPAAMTYVQSFIDQYGTPEVAR